MKFTIDTDVMDVSDFDNLLEALSAFKVFAGSSAVEVLSNVEGLLFEEPIVQKTNSAKRGRPKGSRNNKKA